MKNKLIAATLLLTFNINGMEETSTFTPRLKEKKVFQILLPLEVSRLEKYYQSEAAIKYNHALQDLDKVFDKNKRKSFFMKLLKGKKDITKDEAMLRFICSAARAIIKSPEYGDESSDDGDDLLKNSPDYVYKPPFLFVLIEKLDPITRNYMRRVQLGEK